MRCSVTLGADHTLEYRDGFRDAVKDLTDGRGADVIFDPVGGDTFDEAMRCLNWGRELWSSVLRRVGPLWQRPTTY